MTTKEFLSYFWRIEINDLKRILTPRELSPESQNVYWLGWVKPNLYVRAKDNDIEIKNYFAIDLDLYSEYKKLDAELSTEELLALIDSIKQELDKHPDFKQYSFIVFSWRGMHVYYKGVPRHFDKDVYSNWVLWIYKEFEKYFQSEQIKPDYACRNIARIMRLPWTINSKNWERCRVLYAQPQDSNLFNDIECFAAMEFEFQNAEREKIRKEYELRNRQYAMRNDWGENLYEKINKEFPAYYLAEEIIWFKLAKNWKNFINEHGTYTGYWYDKKNNLIMNGWSTHYFLNHKWYNPFMIAKEYYNLTDKETFEYFKRQFNHEQSQPSQ